MKHHGNLWEQTSQFFANVYLDPLDHFVKDRLELATVLAADGGRETAPPTGHAES